MAYFQNHGNSETIAPGKHMYSNRKKKLKKRAKEMAKENEKTSLLPSDLLAYIRRVEGMLDLNEFDSDEDRTLFLNNVLSEFRGHEMLICQDCEGSKILEKFLQHCSDAHLRVLFYRLLPSSRRLSQDKYGGHVIQTLLTRTMTAALVDDEVEEEDAIELFAAEKTAEESNRNDGGQSMTIDSVSRQVLVLCCELVQPINAEWRHIENGENSTIKLADAVKTGSARKFLRLLLDTYASHVIRTLFNVLSGCRMDDSVVRSSSSRNFKRNVANAAASAGVCGTEGNASLAWKIETPVRFSVPPTFNVALCGLVNLLTDAADAGGDLVENDEDGVEGENGGMEQNELHTVDGGKRRGILRQLATHRIGSASLQAILLAIKAAAPKMTSTVVMSMLGWNGLRTSPMESSSDDDEYGVKSLIWDLVEHGVGSRTMERVLQVADPSDFQLLYARVLRHRLVDFAVHPVANFVVESALVNAPNVAVAGLITDELIGSVEDILAYGNHGVVVRLAEGCAHWGFKQRELVKSLASAFHVGDDTVPSAHRADMWRLVLAMNTYDQLFADFEDDPQAPKSAPLQPGEAEPQLHGALLLQALLRFDSKSAGSVAEPMSDMLEDRLLDMCCHPVASHVCKAFMAGQAAAPKRKKQFVKRLKGHLVKLATDKFGGRVVDAMWAHSDIKTKEIMAAELIEGQSIMRESFFGKFVWRTCRLDAFKAAKGQWADQEERSTRQRDMFDDILNDKPKPPTLRNVGDAETMHSSNANSTKRYDGVMSELGFGENKYIISESNVTSDKGDLVVLEDDDSDNELADAGLTTREKRKKKKAQAATKAYGGDGTKYDAEYEIDDLFRDVKKSVKLSKSEIRQRTNDDGTYEVVEEETAAKKKMRKSMASLLHVIENSTGKKKKSKRSLEDDSNREEKKKKSKTSEKKSKFSMH